MCCEMLQNAMEYATNCYVLWQILWNATEDYKMLQNVTRCYVLWDKILVARNFGNCTLTSNVSDGDVRLRELYSSTIWLETKIKQVVLFRFWRLAEARNLHFKEKWPWRCTAHNDLEENGTRSRLIATTVLGVRTEKSAQKIQILIQPLWCPKVCMCVQNLVRKCLLVSEM